MSKGRNVLVTGGAGYVGAHACKALAAAGYAPVVYDDMSRGVESAVRWGPLIRGDVRDAAALTAAMREVAPLAVVHFAAKAEVGESVRDPMLYYDVNVGGAVALARAAEAAGVDKLIFSSTCAVYGMPARVPIDETTPQQPINPYGASKMMAERVFRDAGGAFGLRTIALRYFNAAGADPDGEIGETHDPETHLIPLAIRSALPGDFRLQLMGGDFPTPDGSAVRDYVHVADLAAAHVLALERLIAGAPGDAFNLGIGRGFSVREVVAAVERTAGRQARVDPAPRRAGDPPELVADSRAARDSLGWRPARTELADIVGDALRWETRAAPA